MTDGRNTVAEARQLARSVKNLILHFTTTIVDILSGKHAAAFVAVATQHSSTWFGGLGLAIYIENDMWTVCQTQTAIES